MGFLMQKAEGGTHFPIHNSNLGDCLELGRNYTLAVTETVRLKNYCASLFREYPAGDHRCQMEYSYWNQNQAFLFSPR